MPEVILNVFFIVIGLVMISVVVGVSLSYLIWRMLKLTLRQLTNLFHKFQALQNRRNW